MWDQLNKTFLGFQVHFLNMNLITKIFILISFVQTSDNLILFWLSVEILNCLILERRYGQQKEKSKRQLRMIS